MKTRQIGDDLAMLGVEVLEGGVLVENVQALPLVEDHADWAVLEHQPRFLFEEHAHLLVQPQLNKVVRQALI